MEHKSIPLYLQALVVVYILLLFGLGVRSLVEDDTRFGWGMFSYELQYSISYSWIDAYGNEVSYSPGDELRARTKRKLSSGRHRTRYGLGAVRTWANGYASYMFDNKNDGAYSAFKVTLLHRKNGEGEYITETFTHPKDV